MNQNEFKLKQAKEFEKEGKYLHALQMYQKLINVDSYKRTAALKLAGIYEKLNKVDSAIKVLDEYLITNIKDTDLRKYFGHFLLRHSYFEKALDVLTSLSREEHSESYFLVGIANYHLCEFEIARLNFKDFIEKNRHSVLLPDAYLFLAKIYLELDNLDESLNSAKYAEKLSNQNNEIYFIIAKIYYFKEMYFHSHDAIMRAIKLNDHDSSLYEWAGKILYKMGEFQKAEYYFQNSLNIFDHNAEIYSFLGLTCLQTGKTHEAGDFFAKALKIDPENSMALEGIKKLSSN